MVNDFKIYDSYSDLSYIIIFSSFNIFIYIINYQFKKILFVKFVQYI